MILHKLCGDDALYLAVHVRQETMHILHGAGICYDQQEHLADLLELGLIRTSLQVVEDILEEIRFKIG